LSSHCIWDNIAQNYVYNNGAGDFTYGTTAVSTQPELVLWAETDGVWEVT
jgi:hypothetical protein